MYVHPYPHILALAEGAQTASLAIQQNNPRAGIQNSLSLSYYTYMTLYLHMKSI